MNETIQYIIVAIIVLAAVAWSVKRIFFTNSCGCGEKNGCDECCTATDGQCGDCPLMNTCKRTVNPKIEK